MPFNTYIGWDIGGAHLKMASINHRGAVNFIRQLATPLWKGLGSLEDAMAMMHREITEESVLHIVTMTAELADIFKDRITGVKELSHLLEKYFKEDSYYLYAGRKGLVKASQASVYINDIASANWHATASFISHHVDDGVMIDIGSTTTDIIPFTSGELLNTAYTDHERLRQNELVYSGIIRTPVMAIVNKIFCDGQWQNITAENFSTMADVYRLTGELNEDDDMQITADGAGKGVSDSARRLARMVGLDHQDGDNVAPIKDMAEHIAHSQLDKINQSLLNILSRSGTKKTTAIVGAGAGRFLARKLASINNLGYIDFTELVSYPKQEEHRVVGCAAAVSVAQIARLEN